MAFDEARKAGPAGQSASVAESEAGAESFRLIEGDSALGVILLCDHAENRIPAAYGDLGLDAESLQRHIAYDPGAAAVTERLAGLLGAPALLSRFSRLLIDPNRGPRDPTRIMQISDGLIIPGNRHLSAEERQARNRRFYEPYHAEIDCLIETAMAAGRVPALLAVHSFTPAWKGVPRPWHAGVLWDKDDRLPLPLLRGLEAEPGLNVDQNVPYSGELKGDTLNRHGTERGLAHALVEIRQDLLRDEKGQAAWAERLARVMQELLADPAIAARLDHVEHFGSHTDKGARGSGRRAGDAQIVPDAPESEAQIRIELEAATFRRLRDHLQARDDVQNIDLMELAGFCRNCLARWYQEAAAGKGIVLSKEEAREIVYGMAYAEWKARFQL